MSETVKYTQKIDDRRIDGLDNNSSKLNVTYKLITRDI